MTQDRDSSWLSWLTGKPPWPDDPASLATDSKASHEVGTTFHAAPRVRRRRKRPSRTSPESVQKPQGLDYVKQLYDDRRAWYQDVQSRAQLILTIDGIAIAFLTGTLLTKASDVSTTIQLFEWDTWVLLALLALSLLFSLLLTSLSMTPRQRSKKLRQDIAGLRGETPYPPSGMWWFVHIGALDKGRFVDEAVHTQPEFAARALADDVFELSHHLERKYRLVRRAYKWTAAALVFFMATGADYLVHVALNDRA